MKFNSSIAPAQLNGYRHNFIKEAKVLKPPTYGRRGGMQAVDRGIRSVARAFGKAPVLSHSVKAGGAIALESESERLVAHMLNLDPNVVSYSPQPFAVELTSGSIARNDEEKAQLRARAKRNGDSAVFYTPDFSLRWASNVQAAVEVKFERYPGDEEYQGKLRLAQDIMHSHGMEFLQVMTPSSWRHPLRVNLPLLNQVNKRQDLWPTTETSTRILDLHETGAKTMGDYLLGLGFDARMSPVLLVSGHLEADVMAHCLSYATPASPAFGDLSHLELVARCAQ